MGTRQLPCADCRCSHKGLSPTQEIHRDQVPEKKCTGSIDIAIDTKEEEIRGHCPKCNEDGKINGWQGTKWDNRK